MTNTLLERLRTKRALPPAPLRRAIREAAGASQSDVAVECGVAQRTVSRWETGAATPRGDHLAAYVELLSQLEQLREVRS